jgi:hypothetical protein
VEQQGSRKGKEKRRDKQQDKQPDDAENAKSMTRIEDLGMEDELEVMYRLKLGEPAAECGEKSKEKE